jgi:hypothetical protein
MTRRELGGVRVATLRTYVDIYFTADGASPLTVAEAIRKATGLTFILGRHDLAFSWKEVTDFQSMIDKLYDALKDKGVFYRFETRDEEDESVVSMNQLSWPPLFTPATQPQTSRR